VGIIQYEKKIAVKLEKKKKNIEKKIHKGPYKQTLKRKRRKINSGR
jgi:hypothetical protein